MTREEFLEYRREIQRRYRERNREKLRRRAKAIYAANPEKEKARHREWVDKNQQHLREYGRARYAKNPHPKRVAAKKFRDSRPGYNAAICKQWVKNNPERVRLLNTIAKHRRRSAAGSFTPDDIIRLRAAQRGKCAHCRTKLTKKNTNIDHIMPIVLGGSNFPENLQLLCEPCNKSKGAKHPIEFARCAGRLL